MSSQLGRTLATFDPNAFENEPGTTVGDLLTRDECDHARLMLESNIDTVMSQISKSEQDAREGRPWEAGWRTRAQNAIRWKRRAISAIRQREVTLPARGDKPAIHDKRRAILKTIEEELGSTEFERLVGIAKDRYGHLWGGEDLQ